MRQSNNDELDQVANVIRGHLEDYIPFQASEMTGTGALDQLHPRFKYVGIALFFLIFSSWNATCLAYLAIWIEAAQEFHTESSQSMRKLV